MSIRWRLTFFHTLTVLAIAGLLSSTLLIVVVRTVGTTVQTTARARAFNAARIIEATGTLTPDDVARLGADDVFLIARDAEGRIVTQTERVDPTTPGPDTGIWQRALATGALAEGHIEFPAVTTFGPVFLSAVPIVRSDAEIRVVEAGKAYSATGRSLFSFLPIVGLAAILGLLLAIGGSYLLARTALAPVDAIVHSARQITEGDLSRRLPIKNPKDELGRLAGTFNDLLARLEVAFAQREEALVRQRQFVGDASHELRTPLTSILGFARMLRRWGLQDPATAQEAAGAIEQEAVRMSRLVEELLRLARGDEAAPLVLRQYDLADVAADAVDAARAAAPDTIDIVWQPPDEPVTATFDRDRVYQVATILLDNAVKYSPNGGQVTVSVRASDGDAALAVSDSGIGIPPQHLPHIFDRFYRVDEARSAGGTGLGLSIARQIAEMHGGRIDVASHPGQGSTFTLRLPLEAWPIDDRARQPQAEHRHTAS